jgi:hypothetical protein
MFFDGKKTFDFDVKGIAARCTIPDVLLTPSKDIAPRVLRQVLTGIIIIFFPHGAVYAFDYGSK